MSAAATAAGYLYASGRLRGRGAREDVDTGHEKPAEKPRARVQARKTRVAVYEPEPQFDLQADPQPQPEKPKRVPKIEYRTRRWTPNE
jgi:hypothetical protein